MVEILQRGRENNGVVSVKAEFEAEGTRMDELMRLVDIARSAGLPLTVKIGGCEALRDLFESKQVGVKYVVAPMVETPYALTKFGKAVGVAYNEEEKEDTEFLFNLETHQAFLNLPQMIEVAINHNLKGIVFGRVDFAGSLGLSRSDINDSVVTEKLLAVASAAKDAGLDLVMGGAISSDTMDVIHQVQSVHLSRFETRKIVFDGEAINSDGISEGLLSAVHFELLWLVNKRDYYGRITVEDEKRIDMLESRWKLLTRD